jgi:hypothetical protein
MDMKKILQALDTASSKPVEGSNDMKKFLSVVTEGANPHKVALPVQMAMQHFQQPKPVVEKKDSAIRKYFKEAEEVMLQQETDRKQLLKQYAQKISKRVLENRYLSYHDELQSRERDEGRAMSRGHRDMDDESNLMYIYMDGRVKQRMIDNYEERSARKQGYRDSPDQALKLHGIIRSKFNPQKWVQKQGTQWVEVHPFGKTE